MDKEQHLTLIRAHNDSNLNTINLVAI